MPLPRKLLPEVEKPPARNLVRGSVKRKTPRLPKGFSKNGGRKRSRTAGLVIANDALYQLSYTPKRE